MPKILAVDDAESMRNMIHKILELAGYDIVLKRGAMDALRYAEYESVDLVLADYIMPEMDGIEMVKELRQIPSYKFTPVFMLTTEFSREREIEGKVAGATGWITKPFDPELLVVTINKALS